MLFDVYASSHPRDGLGWKGPFAVGDQLLDHSKNSVMAKYSHILLRRITHHRSVPQGLCLLDAERVDVSRTVVLA